MSLSATTESNSRILNVLDRLKQGTQRETRNWNAILVFCGAVKIFPGSVELMQHVEVKYKCSIGICAVLLKVTTTQLRESRFTFGLLWCPGVSPMMSCERFREWSPHPSAVMHGIEDLLVKDCDI